MMIVTQIVQEDNRGIAMKKNQLKEDIMISGLPLEDPFNIQSNLVIDFSKVDFSEEPEENIDTSFIYIRNISFNGGIDFSNLSFNYRSRILEKYIRRDIRDFSLKCLDCEIFNIFLDGLIQNDYKCLFSREEIDNFKYKNKDVLDELYTFLISKLIYILSLDKSNLIDANFCDIEHTEIIPCSYECALSLLKYDYSDILCISNEENIHKKPLFYDKLFYYENERLADSVKTSLLSCIYRGVLTNILK